MTFLARDRKCRVCGGLDEFMYEFDWKPVYYCVTCDRETTDSGDELVGPDERAGE